MAGRAAMDCDADATLREILDLPDLLDLPDPRDPVEVL